MSANASVQSESAESPESNYQTGKLFLLLGSFITLCFISILADEFYGTRAFGATLIAGFGGFMLVLSCFAPGKLTLFGAALAITFLGTLLFFLPFLTPKQMFFAYASASGLWSTLFGWRLMHIPDKK